jgi:hypothetical protein
MLCPQRSLLAKITEVFILIVGSVIGTLYLYYRYDVYTKHLASLEKRPMDYTAHEKWISKYPSFAKEAICYAIDEIKKHPKLVVQKLKGGVSDTYQPDNVQITYLAALQKKLRKEFEAVDEAGEIPSSELADKFMKVSYALCALMLEDLPAFVEELSRKGIARSYAEALVYNSDSYQGPIFFECLNAFNWLKKAPPDHVPLYAYLCHDYCDRVEQLMKQNATMHNLNLQEPTPYGALLPLFNADKRYYNAIKSFRDQNPKPQ